MRAPLLVVLVPRKGFGSTGTDGSFGGCAFAGASQLVESRFAYRPKVDGPDMGKAIRPIGPSD